MKTFLDAIGMAILLMAVPAHAKTWYDGGREFGGYVWWDKSCPVSKDSPAAAYDEAGGSLGSAQLIDKGDHVEVITAGSDGTTYLFFKTKEACKRYVNQLKNEQKQEEERINQYR